METSEPETLVTEHEDDATQAETPESIGDARRAPTVRPPASTSPSETSSPSLDLGSSGSLGGGSSTSVATPADTMHLEEIGRTRIFVRYAMGLAVATGVLGPFVGGDARAKVVLYAGLVVVMITTSWLAWRLRDDSGYTVPAALVTAFSCLGGAFCAIWFFGVYSPAPIILPFGLYFFSAAQNFRATLSIFIGCTLVYFVMCLLLWSGVAVDHGIIRGDELNFVDRAIVVLLVEATMIATFLVARNTRVAALRAIELHDKAVRGIAAREALLEEARQDLQAMLRAGGLGRYTDAIVGSFHIGKLIGRGAMGEVYEAAHTESGATAAVKFLQPHVLGDPEMVKRFLREAKIAASLDVPNVVRVLEIGGPEARFPYLAMERLHGEDLADHLRRHRRMPTAKVVQLVREVGRGLEAAREAGIVHRDLKPRNVFLADVGTPPKRLWKILDFGVSKLMDGEGTQTKDSVVGTPGYMAPEQASGQEVSHRTDLYAIGVIAYRALTGRPAFTGDHTAETLYQVVYQMPPRPSEITRLPADVDHVLQIAMAKRVSDRFVSAAELADALEAASRGALDPGDSAPGGASRDEAAVGDDRDAGVERAVGLAVHGGRLFTEKSRPSTA